MTKEEAIEALYRTDKLGVYSETHGAVNMAIEALKTQKVGKWIDSTIPESTLMMCSVCKYDLGSFRFNYCPNCGAKMVDTICDCFRHEFGKDVCYGTREREVCKCKGDRGKCNFY